jgi:hypothetical protein
MYSYVRAICLSRSIGSQWSERDLRNISVYDLFNNFTKIYLELSHSALIDNVYVDMDSLRLQYSNYQGTLEEFLVFNDNNTLTTVPSLPTMDVKYAKYSDAIRVGYHVETGLLGQELPDNYPQFAREDLVVTRPRYKTDMQVVYDHALVSVNGYFHRTDCDGENLYVLQGGKSMQRSKDNHLGILSFLDIGKIKIVPIDQESIIPVNSGTALKDSLRFTINEDLTGKSCILVLGGYLVFPQDNVFYRTSDNGFNLDIKLLPYLERIFESNLYLDLSPLELNRINQDDSGYDVQELYSDSVIKKYMTMSQSFMVIIDVPHLTTNKIHVRHSSVPGMFTCYQDPVYPLVVNHGRCAEYWKVLEDGVWSLSVHDSFLRNYVISNQKAYDLHRVTDNLLATKPFYHSRGFLLEIAGYQTL